MEENDLLRNHTESECVEGPYKLAIQRRMERGRGRGIDERGTRLQWRCPLPRLIGSSGLTSTTVLPHQTHKCLEVNKTAVILIQKPWVKDGTVCGLRDMGGKLKV